MQKLEDFDWNDLRYALAIARAGTLAGAARALKVNHSTVFRRLNAFEDALGVRLFERLPEGYVPTVEGEQIRRHAEAVEASVHALERSVAGRDFRLSGEIRLTTAPTLASDYVAGYLAEFLKRYPEITVEIAVGDHDYDLARREADVALRATTRPPDFLVGRRVLSSRWFVHGAAKYLRARGTPRSMQELEQHALIGPDDAFTRLPVFAWMRRTYPPARMIARANALSTMRALARAGLGLAFLPSDQHEPGLTRLFPVEPEFAGALWLLTHPDLRHVARIKVFMEFLAEKLRADPRLRES
jgi:DNA-binding transcriptional LysR family regulator